jgi:hypothetical protein
VWGSLSAWGFLLFPCSEPVPARLSESSFRSKAFVTVCLQAGDYVAGVRFPVFFPVSRELGREFLSHDRLLRYSCKNG